MEKLSGLTLFEDRKTKIVDIKQTPLIKRII
jgi:hypothetical protein